MANQKIKATYKALADGTATYAQAQEFAVTLGEILAGAFAKHLSSSQLPDGKMYYNVANRILHPTMGGGYELVADYSRQVQEIINRSLGIGIKAIQAPMNKDKIDGLINIVSNAEQYDDVAYALGEPVVNFMSCIVDDTVKANARFQRDAGLSPKIKRTATGGCCEWCRKLAGTYDYNDVSDTGNNVFRRHQYCRCLVEYDGGGDLQNVYSKKRYKANDIDARIRASVLERADARRKSDIDKRQRLAYAKKLKPSDIDRMSQRELEKTAKNMAMEYHKKDFLKLHTEGRTAEEIAEILVLQDKTRSALKNNILKMQNTLNTGRMADIIKPTEVLTGHVRINLTGETPGKIVDHYGRKNKVETRVLFDNNGMRHIDITTHDHDNNKQHGFGLNGEHKHVYDMNKIGTADFRPTRPLTIKDRERNRDIL